MNHSSYRKLGKTLEQLSWPPELIVTPLSLPVNIFHAHLLNGQMKNDAPLLKIGLLFGQHKKGSSLLAMITLSGGDY